MFETVVVLIVVGWLVGHKRKDWSRKFEDVVDVFLMTGRIRDVDLSEIVSSDDKLFEEKDDETIWYGRRMFLIE